MTHVPGPMTSEHIQQAFVFSSRAISFFCVAYSSRTHLDFYLQGCAFSVFLPLCLIDSNMGFPEGLSSDLFPQELMTSNHFKGALDENVDLRGLKQLHLI